MLVGCSPRNLSAFLFTSECEGTISYQLCNQGRTTTCSWALAKVLFGSQTRGNVAEWPFASSPTRGLHWEAVASTAHRTLDRITARTKGCLAHNHRRFCQVHFLHLCVPPSCFSQSPATCQDSGMHCTPPTNDLRRATWSVYSAGRYSGSSLGNSDFLALGGDLVIYLRE